jgi:hypothetical protein
MGFNQSSAKSSAFSTMNSTVRSGDLFSAVLAGFGIWTTPSPAAKPQPASNNVFPLRVIRVRDTDNQTSSASNAPKMAGRMVISGRMADVCAELDRLAA